MQAARITVLSENTARGAGIVAEHGLSFFIETPGARILFDTGERLEQTVSAIEEIDPMSIYPVHCTGWDAASRLWSEFPGRVHGLPVTSVLEW